jgi:hypothetical protein
MKTVIFLFLLMINATGQSIYEFRINSLEGEEINFERYKGKKVKPLDNEILNAL